MLSVIVPTVNRRQSLVKLINSLRSQNFPSSEFEVLVVYNSLKGHKSLPSWSTPEFPVRTLVAPKPGVNHARNTGISAARGDILVFIDDDCVLANKNYLSQIRDLHAAHPEVIGIGGPYVLNRRSTFWSRVYHKNMDLWLNTQRAQASKSRALLGGNATYKVRAFNEGARFTPGIVYGGSETPLNLELFEKYGPFLFLQNLALEHRSRMGLWDFVKKAYKQGQGFAVQTKWRPQQIQNAVPITPGVSWLTKKALWLYSFLFMIGFRTSILERRGPWFSLLEELGVYFKKPVSRYWNATRESYSYVRAQRDA